VALARGERVLAATETAGGWLVATDRALWLPALPDGHLAWTLIDSARWDSDAQLLTIRRATAVGERTTPVLIGLPSPSGVLDIIRERVTACVVMSRTVQMEGRRGFTLVARRAPWAPQEPLAWDVRLEAGVDPSDPVVSEAVSQALRDARAEVGQ
jgi:hypothetical protein